MLLIFSMINLFGMNEASEDTTLGSLSWPLLPLCLHHDDLRSCWVEQWGTAACYEVTSSIKARKVVTSINKEARSYQQILRIIVLLSGPAIDVLFMCISEMSVNVASSLFSYQKLHNFYRPPFGIAKTVWPISSYETPLSNASKFLKRL